MEKSIHTTSSPILEDRNKMDITTEIFRFAKEVVGKPGPININSGIMRFYARLESSSIEDGMVVGKEGFLISFEDISELVTKLAKRADEVFRIVPFDEWLADQIICDDKRMCRIALSHCTFCKLSAEPLSYEIIWNQ